MTNICRYPIFFAISKLCKVYFNHLIFKCDRDGSLCNVGPDPDFIYHSLIHSLSHSVNPSLTHSVMGVTVFIFWPEYSFVQKSYYSFFGWGGGGCRSSGSWSANPLGPGIWFIFCVSLMKIKKMSLENWPPYANANQFPSTLVPNNL